jgi:DNA repair proteins
MEYPIHQPRRSVILWQIAFLRSGGTFMKQTSIRTSQQELFSTPSNVSASKFISIYRVCLVKDATVSFGQSCISNSHQAHALIQNLILTRGQPDREQFVVALLNAKNNIIGLNIVSVGVLSSAPIHPREVLKPAILANAAAMILCHNHPTGNLHPSNEDLAVTEKIIRAADIVGIQVHEHLIINTEDDLYYSFADQGIIKQMYDKID